MTFYGIQEKMNKKIKDAISAHIKARGENARARTFKVPIREVVAEEGFVVLKCATRMGRWCSCGHENCSNSFPVRELFVTLSKGANKWHLKYQI